MIESYKFFFKCPECTADWSLYDIEEDECPGCDVLVKAEKKISLNEILDKNGRTITKPPQAIFDFFENTEKDGIPLPEILEDWWYAETVEEEAKNNEKN